MKNVQPRSAPKKMMKRKRAKLGAVTPTEPDIETKHIEDEAEPLGANFA